MRVFVVWCCVFWAVGTGAFLAGCGSDREQQAAETIGQRSMATTTTSASAASPKPDHVVAQELRAQVGALKQKHGVPVATWSTSDQQTLKDLHERLRQRHLRLQGTRAPSFLAPAAVPVPSLSQWSAYFQAKQTVVDLQSEAGRAQLGKLKQQILYGAVP